MTPSTGTHSYRGQRGLESANHAFSGERKGATRHLSLASTVGNSLRYSIVVTNSFGSLVASNAVLTVNLSLVFYGGFETINNTTYEGLRYSSGC